MQYIGMFDGRMVQATYELRTETIVITGVKVMTAGSWEEQTSDALESLGQWMIEEYGDDMMSPAR